MPRDRAESRPCACCSACALHLARDLLSSTPRCPRALPGSAVLTVWLLPAQERVRAEPGSPLKGRESSQTPRRPDLLRHGLGAPLCTRGMSRGRLCFPPFLLLNYFGSSTVVLGAARWCMGVFGDGVGGARWGWALNTPAGPLGVSPAAGQGWVVGFERRTLGLVSAFVIWFQGLVLCGFRTRWHLGTVWCSGSGRNGSSKAAS